MMQATRRTFLGGLAAVSVPVAAIAATETLEDRIKRIELDLVDALNEKWPLGCQVVRPPYGNGAVFFLERDPEAKEVV